METLFTSNTTSADQLRFRMNRCCRIAEIHRKNRNFLDRDSSEKEASSASANISTQTALEILSFCQDIVVNGDRKPQLACFDIPASGGRGRGRGRGLDMSSDRERPRGRGGGGGSSSSGGDKINSLGRLMTSILRHKAADLNLNMRSDGYVKVQDLLKLNKKTFSNIPLSSHTVDEVREAVRMDNKQRFSLLEENGELLIRANQGHSVKTVETESLLQPILSADEVPVCVHGTYKRNLDSILQSGLKRMNRLHVHFSRGLPRDGNVISGMRQNVNVLIFLDVRKALEEGMKLYISDNQVILTEGFDGVVPVKYFEKIESWPDRRPIPFSDLDNVMAAFNKVLNSDV